MTDVPDGQGLVVNLVLKPVWASEEGTDKDFYAITALPIWGASASSAYVVPAGKTLTITDVSAQVQPSQAQYDHQWWCGLTAAGGVAGASKINATFSGGGSISLSKPIVTPAGETFTVASVNLTDQTAVNIVVCAHGYEV